jgi:DNA-binding MarR family transcriptional regulator
MLEVGCYCTRLRRAARALTEHYDAALAPAGLKVTQYALLRAIGRLDAPCITELAEATGLDRSTLGRNLGVLRRAGLVALGPGDDERTRVVSITAKGDAAVTAALPLWAEAQERIAATLGPEGGGALAAALDRLARLGAAGAAGG